jgi:hypothetical protein
MKVHTLPRRRAFVMPDDMIVPYDLFSTSPSTLPVPGSDTPNVRRQAPSDGCAEHSAVID